MPSHFTFTFRFRPWEYCLHLNFDRKELAPGFGAVCVRDYLGIFWAGMFEQNEMARNIAYNLARVLVHSHAYFSFPKGAVLEVEPLIWSEARDCVPKESVYGYMHPSLQTAPLRHGHRDNTPLLRAAELSLALQNSMPLQLALADFHAARRRPGPYQAFYAFRVLEDVGFMFGTKKGFADWGAMNKAFKTTEKKWAPLTKAGKWARHLSPENLRKLAQTNQKQMLSLSHKALTLALAHRGFIPKK
jgi:hypothetical protein